jgi:hypothetical protein
LRLLRTAAPNADQFYSCCLDQPGRVRHAGPRAGPH